MAGHVLVVDDSALNRRVLTSVLGRADIPVVVAASGSEALEAARKDPPDLVLLDVMMPGMDGFAVCQELQGREATARVPVIFLSTLEAEEQKTRGLAAGAVDYIAKPFRTAEILARVHVHLRLRPLAEKLRARNRDLVAKQARIDEDVQAAAVIQEALIPQPGLAVPGVSVAWIWPCVAVGGDILNVMRLDEEHVAFYLLDVSGHGVPPATVALCAYQSLSPAAGLVARRRPGCRPSITCPEEVLWELDAQFPFSRFDRDFTISYLVLNAATGGLRYASAGHPPPLVLTAGGCRPLEEGGAIIGLGSGGFEAGEVELGAGDRVVLCSDGILEAEGPDHHRFGAGLFRDTLRDLWGAPLVDVCPAIRGRLLEFTAGRALGDDVSLLAFEYAGSP